jgi:hypothetical protein
MQLFLAGRAALAGTGTPLARFPDLHRQHLLENLRFPAGFMTNIT